MTRSVMLTGAVLGALFVAAGLVIELPAAAAGGVGLTVMAVHTGMTAIGPRGRARTGVGVTPSPAGPATTQPSEEASPAAAADVGDRPTALLPEASFRREGDYWTISYRGTTSRLKDAKGMGYVRRLLAHPNQELHVVDLVVGGTDPSAVRSAGSAEADDLRTGADDAGAMLDAQAKEAYRRRLEDLRADAEEAREWGDAEREARAEEEIAALARELARAVGLDGRDRKAASASERARVNVTRAVKGAIDRIAEHDPRLGRHLSSTVHTGTFCCYRPDPETAPDWEL